MTANKWPNPSLRIRKGASEKELWISVGEHTRVPRVEATFESMYSGVADQNTKAMPLHIQEEATHDNEMNDHKFNIDVNMNMRDIARNVIQLISCHL
jgi:hypothetical protein